MDINVAGRHTDVTERFQRHINDKLDKVNQLAPNASRTDVVVMTEKNPRLADQKERIELTVHDNGTVIRSEASAADQYAALDLAYDKLMERLRRLRDRRKDRRKGRDRAHQVETESLRTMGEDQVHMDRLIEEQKERTATGSIEAVDPEPDTAADAPESPVVIREKKHKAEPMTIDDALYRMELVGHDFFLFVDKDTNHPKVVYRRKGWNYGVIELDTDSQ
ncbi:ribosome-associated translation inhibitor RaiA [Helcobacillus massiliensis]|uniref:Ribosome hibernation promoting factor n=1 Tax=Helcobacillus massiliensis TaxID=521392 RepID=A0A839QX80_9MICO|nr:MULTISPECIES: ribosome-associated translation inhibitor RaiA [Helcobacillus]MBB3021987.1 ribosomal subunit interface protein [Helcobacillus massiliensis]MCG7426881.1 ribosome-associated translation inhibitor RaiA [Helcobacillus sp. ACRRO]MCT1557457.1 ribosome-associated translation inhibitor RaiA [Helcobacillus massiliensis]MCT2036362.1 ribosome-associated translation inhibitor RaiA [Helcobacillus massiliensis]MCT2331896.1 ribosome-associated translation inhibitor RaiA [Helcobacillus massil